jgi:hypothetical protein
MLQNHLLKGVKSFDRSHNVCAIVNIACLEMKCNVLCGVSLYLHNEHALHFICTKVNEKEVQNLLFGKN